jgi:hypothetical protein
MPRGGDERHSAKAGKLKNVRSLGRIGRVLLVTAAAL